jgi:cyclase
MHRRSFIQQSAMAFGALSVANQSFLSALFQEPWKITMLRKDTGIFTERGGTILFHLAKDGIVVVDSQFPDQSKHLIDELKKKSSQPFRLLINTHHHGDHSGGNIAFKGVVDHVLAHANSKINQQNANRNKNEDQQLYPDQTFTHIWCEKFGKENICLRYFGPGHTNGDSLVHFQHANIVHMGDLLFNRRHPFIDRAAGANINNWIKVLDKAVDTFNKKTLYVYGHAASGYEVTGNREDLKRFGDYLGRLLQFTEAEIKAGKSKEEILKNTELPGETQWKGDGFQRPLQAAYEELTSK